MSKIQVYDLFAGQYRNLMPSNCDLFLDTGAVLFQKPAQNIITEYYVICGYILISKKGNGPRYPIDVHSDRIVMTEGAFNCLPRRLRKKLKRYNIIKTKGPIWSSFFVEWLFQHDWSCFVNNGPFIKMSTYFAETKDIVDQMIKNDISIIEPHDYDELCCFANNSIGLSGVDFFSKDYNESIKYLIDAFLHHYHIVFSHEEVIEYAYQICHIINLCWEKENG